jgi:hypothetical protein
LLSAIVDAFDINDPDNTVKMKLYRDNQTFFDLDWHAYWSSFDTLKSYRGNDNRFIEFVLNSDGDGIVILSYAYNPDEQQVLSNVKQIRYGSSSAAVDVYKKKQEEGHKVLHDGENKATLTKEGQVNYTVINLSSPEAAILYNQTVIIDLQ